MRRIFKDKLHEQMKNNQDIFVLTGDLGYGMFDIVQKDFPDRFINCGASEQAMLGMAIGLALKGKIPFAYSITNFLVYRPYETIRNYISHENIPVRLVAGGRDFDYSHDGISHHSHDLQAVLEALQSVAPKGKGIKKYVPYENGGNIEEQVEHALNSMISDNSPSIIWLKR